jgi:hypothetical protein
MAKYTIELGYLVFNSKYNIFNFDYSFYDETKKVDLQNKFIQHFRYREIGTETPTRFKDNLQIKFNEVLPFYNMLFETALINYEKTINYSLTETINNSKLTNNSGSQNIYTQIKDTKNSVNNGSETVTNTTTATGSTTDNGSSTQHEDHDNEVSTKGTNKDDTNGSKTSTVETDNLNVQSDTPNGMLSIGSIKNNTYASKSDMLDGLQKTTDVDNTLITHTLDTIASDKGIITSNNSHDNHLTSNNSENGNTQATRSNNTTDSSTNDLTSTTGSTNVNNETGTTTHTTRGSYGVITEADMLQKHINLQKTLQSIYLEFFKECDDLFMQVY